MADTLRRLAYDEAVRMINAQAGVLDNLRARAGTLISASSLVTSFLAGQVLAKPALERRRQPRWDPDYEQALLDLATFHDENHDANAARLRRLFHVFQAGCVLLVVETLAWIIDLNR